MMNRIIRIVEFATNIIKEPIFSPYVDDHAQINPGETSGKYSLAVPGYSKEDIQLKKQGNKITIMIRNKPVKSLFIEEAIDKENIEAHVDKGILTLHFNKNTLDEGENIDIN